MKTKKMTKALLSVALVMAMLFSMCIVGFTGVSAAGLDLNYEFAYKNAGYAEGRLSLSGTSGTYILYWSNDTGALEGYAGIAQIEASSSKKYFNMPANTAIPAGATKVIAVKSGTTPTVANASAVFDIPADKQFKGGTKQYDFMALSDIHIDYGNWYTYAKEHLANSLEVAAKRDVEFITTCGDNMNGNSGTDKYSEEWKTYQKIIASSNYNNPIYETNGNHETYNDGGNITDDIPYTFGLETYKTATGLNVITGKMQKETYYEKTINGDHYIFMVLELSKDPGKSNEFTDAQLTWLEKLLDKYEGDGHRVFINEHALFRGYGAGDNKISPLYGAGLVDTYPQVKRLKGILEEHKDVIFFSGHTHIDFKYGYNFDNENGKTAYTVHIPSNASTTHPNSSNTGLDYIHDINSSQGYLVDVYDDYVILNGTDLAFNLICPSYTYMVDYTGQTLEKNELEEIVYDTVTVTVDVSNLTDAPQSVVCIAVDEGNSANNQSIPMTKNADGTYSAKVIAEYSSVYFAINGDTGVKTSAFPVANCKITLGSQKLTYTPSGSVTTNVHAHVWGDGGDGTTWPGVPMTLGNDGKYTALVPASDFTGVVFDEGKDADQTSDLNFADYASDFVADVYINLDGDNPTEPATNPTQATPVATEPSEPAETDPSEIVTKPTEPSVPTTQPTDPTESTPTEPEVDELAPVVIVEYDDGCFFVEAYAADGAEDVQFKFAVSGTTVQDYSDKSRAMFSVASDGMYVLEVNAKYSDGTEHKSTVMIEVKDGEAILPEMPERPTAPKTEPIETSTPDETVPTTETTAPQVEYMYGDADLNEKINVKDATTVQKHTAKMLTLEDKALTQADVTGDGKVNIKDATSIQKYVAKLITVFPVEEGAAELASVGASSTLMNEVKNVLSKEYQYASYDAYMALKKAYMNNVSDTELNKAYTDYKTMKSNNPVSNPGGTANIGDINIGQTGQGSPVLPGPTFGGGSSGGSSGDNSGGNSGGSSGGTTDMIKIYFVKPDDWENAYLYSYYGSGTVATTIWSSAYPGNKMTFVETDDNGSNIYVGEVPADINVIKFADGSSTNLRTDVIETFKDGICFKLGASFGTNKWYVDEYAYAGNDSGNEDNQGGNNDNQGGNTGGDTGSFKVYAINSANWSTLAAHVWNTGGSGTTWPGTVMTKTSDKVNGFDVYSVSFDKEYGNIIFNDNKVDGAAQTDTLAFQTGKYYDVKTGLCYDKLSDVPAPSKTNANVFLAGEFNSWSTTKNEFSFKAEGDTVCYLEMDLAANTSYKFKVITYSSTNEIEWRGLKNDGATITDSVADIVCSRNEKGDATMTTKAAGKYVFVFDTVNYTLSITFPG
ncbi:MAG: starch-binding protein [Clostridia bacterium]|nr:starch-binding protein [Clostridia bacterium]